MNQTIEKQALEDLIFDKFKESKRETLPFDGGGGGNYFPPNQINIGTGGDCPDCDGEGVTFKNGLLKKCQTCKGTGKI